jgi:hypothetical protein
MNQIGKMLQAIASWIKINQKEILKVLWTIVLWSRGLIVISFILVFNLYLVWRRGNFELKDVFYKIRLVLLTSFFLHFIYMILYFSKM